MSTLLKRLIDGTSSVLADLSNNVLAYSPASGSRDETESLKLDANLDDLW